MGASTIALLAGEYPHLVSRIALEDPPWRSETLESAHERQAFLAAWRQEIVENQSKPRQEIMALVRRQNPTWNEIEYGPWVDAKRSVSPRVFDIVSTERTWQADVLKIACPTLLITADPDRGALVTPQVAQQVAEMNGVIQVAHIPGAGHNIRREQFQAYVREAKKFLAETKK